MMKNTAITTKTYFLRVGFQMQSSVYSISLIAETDETEERRGTFVWPMSPEHEHKALSDRAFQDALYDAVVRAIWNMGLKEYLDMPGSLIKMPSGSTWDMHVDRDTAYLLTQVDHT